MILLQILHLLLKYTIHNIQQFKSHKPQVFRFYNLIRYISITQNALTCTTTSEESNTYNRKKRCNKINISVLTYNGWAVQVKLNFEPWIVLQTESRQAHYPACMHKGKNKRALLTWTQKRPKLEIYVPE